MVQIYVIFLLFFRRREHIRTVQASLENGSVLYSAYHPNNPKYNQKRPYDCSVFSDVPPSGNPGGQQGGNDYHHNWQVPTSDPYKYEHNDREHIYESPQFKRRYPGDAGEGSTSTADSAQENAPSAYYYEIDPASAQAQTLGRGGVGTMVHPSNVHLT